MRDRHRPEVRARSVGNLVVLEKDIPVAAEGEERETVVHDDDVVASKKRISYMHSRRMRTCSVSGIAIASCQDDSRQRTPR
ncbi:hypothetical protein MRX96_022968 [Rhipicephalus microplus]